MSTPGHRNSLDWTLFAVLTVLWALAYPGNRLAVNMSDPAHGFPPQLVTAARLCIGAAILMGIAIWKKERFPPLTDWRRWGTLFVLGFVGMTAPFLAITFAQRTVDSSLAARKELAKELHYDGDSSDSATMNIWLHKQVIRKLAENGGKVPDDLKT